MGFFTSGKGFFVFGLILVVDQLVGLFFGINISGMMIQATAPDNLDVFPTVIGLILIGIGYAKWDKEL